MAEAPANITVPGTGTLHVAPAGTTLPTGPSDALDAAFKDMGVIHEDGATFSDGKSPGTPAYGWSRRAPYRRPVGNSDPTLQLSLREWSQETFPVVFGGGVVATTTGGHSFIPPTTSDIVEYAVVLEMTDGSTKTVRLVCPKCTVLEPTEQQFAKTEGSSLPLNFALAIPDDGGPEWRKLLAHPGFTLV